LIDWFARLAQKQPGKSTQNRGEQTDQEEALSLAHGGSMALVPQKSKENVPAKRGGWDQSKIKD